MAFGDMKEFSHFALAEFVIGDGVKKQVPVAICYIDGCVPEKQKFEKWEMAMRRANLIRFRRSSHLESHILLHWPRNYPNRLGPPW